MDRRERAETAVRLVGLVALVHGGAAFVYAVVHLALTAQRTSPGGLWVIAECAGPVLEALLGTGLLAGAGAVAELLVPRGGESEGPSVAEMAELGAFGLGVYFLVGVLVYLTWVATMTAQTIVLSGGSWWNALPGRQLGPPYRTHAVQVVTGGLVAAALLAGGQLLVRWGPARRRLGRRLSPAAALATGFALVAVFIAGRTAVVYMYQMARLGRLGAPLAGGTAVSAPLVWQDVDTALRLVEVLVILLLCARAGRWLARGAPKGPRPVLPALGREGWMTAALAGLLLWGMLDADGQAARSGGAWPDGAARVDGAVGRGGRGARVEHGCHGRRRPVGAGRGGCRRGGAAGQEGDRGAALVAVEVALTVAALVQLLGPGGRGKRALLVAADAADHRAGARCCGGTWRGGACAGRRTGQTTCANGGGRRSIPCSPSWGL